jgi:hypothetical protein
VTNTANETTCTTTSIRLAWSLMKTTKKTRGRKRLKLKTYTTTTYKHLYDGVHPDHWLTRVWTHMLLKVWEVPNDDEESTTGFKMADNVRDLPVRGHTRLSREAGAIFQQ